jgi:serum/glucocorticoid-regulated kinase 2
MVDYFHLGVLLYEMLVGLPPFYNSNKQRMYENIENAEAEFPEYVSEMA